jgi:hypothetical protein
MLLPDIGQRNDVDIHFLSDSAGALVMSVQRRGALIGSNVKRLPARFAFDADIQVSISFSLLLQLGEQLRLRLDVDAVPAAEIEVLSNRVVNGVAGTYVHLEAGTFVREYAPKNDVFIILCVPDHLVVLCRRVFSHEVLLIKQLSNSATLSMGEGEAPQCRNFS